MAAVPARKTAPGFVKRLVPERWRPLLRGRYLAFRYRGDRVECPCCGGRFAEFMPDWNRPNAICPRCAVHERHRALWLYLHERTDLLERRARVLHFAPEEVFQRRFGSLPNLDYLSADLDSPLAMVHFDIQGIPYDADSFDVILCVHVLEHVPDDAQAMRELHRVLRPGGFAIVGVPLDRSREATYEDPAIVSPEERRRAFWQDDHVRLYGRDFPERLRAAGFDVRVDEYIRELPEETRIRYGIRPDDIFIATKSA
jgi:SAM-dependent methyltransferase